LHVHVHAPNDVSVRYSGFLLSLLIIFATLHGSDLLGVLAARCHDLRGL
jgi:hypothetical protein